MDEVRFEGADVARIDSSGKVIVPDGAKDCPAECACRCLDETKIKSLWKTQYEEARFLLEQAMRYNDMSDDYRRSVKREIEEAMKLLEMQ